MQSSARPQLAPSGDTSYRNFESASPLYQGIMWSHCTSHGEQLRGDGVVLAIRTYNLKGYQGTSPEPAESTS